MADDERRISLADGNGGTQMLALLRATVFPAIAGDAAADEEDAALLSPEQAELVFTTDGFTVRPLFFPGGDIGHLAICGSVNDVAMMGGAPVAVALSLILEAGLPVTTLERVMASIRATADAAGVRVVTGDTKVVEPGAADGMYVTTSVVGWKRQAAPTGAGTIADGDAVIVSGSIGHHGVAIMAAREQLPFVSEIVSDAAPLNGMVMELLAACPSVRWLRDATRGGVAAVLNECAQACGMEIEIDDTALPVAEDVKGAAEVLGLDPLYMANEGRCVVVCPVDSAVAAVEALRAHPYGRNAARIGTVRAAGRAGRVVLTTGYGARRVVAMPSGEQLPRIC